MLKVKLEALKELKRQLEEWQANPSSKDISLEAEDLNARDSNGGTILHWACQKGYLAV